MNELLQLVRQQSESIQSLRAQLSLQIKNEIEESKNYLEAQGNLRVLLGELPAALDGVIGAPHVALNLVQLIRDNSHDFIVEFGSGVNTYLMLRALQLLPDFDSVDVHSLTLPRLLSFDHTELSIGRTRGLVADCIGRDQLDLRFVPLTSWSDVSGSYFYYDCVDILKKELLRHAEFLRQSGINRSLRLLVVVDGSPVSVSDWSSYPALPIVLDAASSLDVSIDFFLEEVVRCGDQDIASIWEEIVRQFGIDCQRHSVPLNSGGLLLSLATLDGVNTSLSQRDVLENEKRQRNDYAAARARVEALLVELEEVRRVAAVALQDVGADRDEQIRQRERLTDEIRVLEEERDKFIEKKEVAEQESKLILEQLHAVQEELERYFLKCSELEDKNAVLDRELADLGSKCKALEGQLVSQRERLTSRCDELNQECARLRTRRDQLVARRDQLSQERDQHASAAAELGEQLEQQRLRALELAASVDTLERQRDQLGEERNQLILEREQLSQERDQHASAAAELGEQLEQQRLRALELAASVDTLERQRDQLGEERNQLILEREQLSQERDQHASAAAELGEQLEQQQRRTQDLEQQSSVERDRFKVRYDELIQECQRLASRRDQLIRRRDQLIDERDQHAAVAADLQQQLKQQFVMAQHQDDQNSRTAESLRLEIEERDMVIAAYGDMIDRFKNLLLAFIAEGGSRWGFLRLRRFKGLRLNLPGREQKYLPPS